MSNGRGKNWRLSDDASDLAIHKWLSRHYPKTGICERCGASGRTEYASVSHEHYTRNRADYFELCNKCHAVFDNKTGTPKSPEHIEKVRKALTGRKLSEAHRAAIGASRKGKPLSDEHRAAISKGSKGHRKGPHSVAHRAAIGQASRKAWRQKWDAEAAALQNTNVEPTIA